MPGALLGVCLALSGCAGVAAPPTTGVSRNRNMAALQAGYLFPEARALHLAGGVG